MNNYNHIVINKNRGWRGLAEVKIIDLEKKEQLKMIFSFSQAVWDDLIIHHKIVMQDDDYYYVIKFKDESGRLPKATQQRSVLIKSFNDEIESISQIEKSKWTSSVAEDWSAIAHFLKNKNNHTTSDWNCIGIRVIPEI